ncbi:MAG: hypothetical protein SGCHY_003804 [Lobulomycetales sp.]
MLNSRYQRLLGTFLLFSFGALLFNLLLPLKAFDARPRQRQLESLSESKAKIQLISQWYWPRNALRTAELIRALRLNLENTAIDEIHLLQPSGPSENARTNKSNDDNDSEPFAWSQESMLERLLQEAPDFPTFLFQAKIRVKTTTHPSRLKVADALAYANAVARNQIAILHNLDIFFDDTLHLLHSPDSDLGRFTAYFLSRWEESDDTPGIGTQCGEKFIGSHDAFVFIPPVPKILAPRTQFEMGSWGMESRLLWEFEQVGIYGRNPCKDIKIWHSHKSQYKSSWMPEVNKEGKSSVAFPDTLISSLQRGYTWEERRG